jgi:sugar/nucleoside kinase (ribokinase family)
MPEVVGLGHCNHDILALVPGLPDFDDLYTTPLGDLVHDGGGPVGTALAALARLGVWTGYIGVVGDDDEGRAVRGLFVEAGVETGRMRLQADMGTNVCLVLVDQTTGKRALLGHRRTDRTALKLDDADRVYIESARVLHLDGQFMPAALQAAQWAKDAGVTVSFDANHPRPGLDELLPLVDWLVAAEAFPTAQTGIPDLEEASRQLLSLGPQLVVLTCGPRGSYGWTEQSHAYAPGCRVPVTDTTGAGDAYRGAFLYGMLCGWELGRAMSFANAAAAINCQTLGGRRGLPTLPQVEALLAEYER